MLPGRHIKALFCHPSNKLKYEKLVPEKIPLASPLSLKPFSNQKEENLTIIRIIVLKLVYLLDNRIIIQKGEGYAKTWKTHSPDLPA
jgi:hypothetical protein